MNDFLGAIRFFESENIGIKPQTELIRGGIEVFKNLPGFVSAAYYNLDQLEYDFHFKLASDTIAEEELKKSFTELSDNGIIARSLNLLEIIEQNGEFNSSPVSRMIIPLIGLKNVPGVFLVILTEALGKENYIYDVCRLFCRNLALLINNIELQEENEQLNETTEQKIAIRLKNISRDKYEIHEILDSIQAGILFVNKDTDQIEEANVTAASIIGAPKEKLIGTSSQSYFLSLEIKSINEIRTSKEGLIKRNNGKLLPIIKTSTSLMLGNEEYLIHTFIDISERKRMEEALQDAHYILEQRVEERTIDLTHANESLQEEMQERIKAEKDLVKLFWAVNQNPCAIILLDLNGIVDYANPKFEEITGIHLNKTIGKNARTIIPRDFPQEYFQTIFEDINKGIEWQGDFRIQRPGGDFYWISATVSSIRNNEGEIVNYMVVAEDITGKKNAEEELLFAKKKVEDSNKFKSYLLQNMSHEFRTPLISILGFSQIMKDEITDPDHNKMMNSIYFSGRRLLRTIDGVLNLSQVEANELVINRKLVDLSEFLPLKTEQFIDFAIRENLAFNISYKTDNLKVLIDDYLFSLVIHNLLDNAFKYTNIGSVDIVVDKINNEGIDWAIIKVIDTGIGIPETHQQIIFEAFRQVSEGLARRYEGCGIGLTLSWKLMELMDGRITLESVVGKGSIFTIWLPVIK